MSERRPAAGLGKNCGCVWYGRGWSEAFLWPLMYSLSILPCSRGLRMLLRRKPLVLVPLLGLRKPPLLLTPRIAAAIFDSFALLLHFERPIWRLESRLRVLTFTAICFCCVFNGMDVVETF